MPEILQTVETISLCWYVYNEAFSDKTFPLAIGIHDSALNTAVGKEHLDIHKKEKTTEWIWVIYWLTFCGFIERISSIN